MFLSAFLLLFSACKMDVESQNQGGKIKVDGNIEEWSGDLIIFQEEGMVCAVSHDDDYLYVALSSRNQETLRAMLRSGLTLWLNDAGKSRKHYGIQYPKPLDPVEFKNMMGNNRSGNNSNRDRMMQGRQVQNRLLTDVLSIQREFAILSDTDKIKAIFPIEGSSHIQLATTFKNGQFSYECAIPLSDSEKEYHLLRNKKNRINIGIEIPMPEFGGMSGMSPGTGGGKGGRSSSASGASNPAMNGQRGGGGGMRAAGSFTSVDLWLKIHLNE